MLRTAIPCCDYWQNWDMAQAKSECCFAAPCRLATGSGEMNHLWKINAFNTKIILNYVNGRCMSSVLCLNSD